MTTYMLSLLLPAWLMSINWQHLLIGILVGYFAREIGGVWRAFKTIIILLMVASVLTVGVSIALQNTETWRSQLLQRTLGD